MLAIQVTLQIEPQFKRSVTHDLTSDEELETRLFETAKYQEFGDIRWFPSLGQIMYRADNRVPLSTPGDGAYDLFRPAPAQPVIAARAGGKIFTWQPQEFEVEWHMYVRPFLITDAHCQMFEVFATSISREFQEAAQTANVEIDMIRRHDNVVTHCMQRWR